MYRHDEKKPAKKTTQGSAKRTAASKSETFTAEERAAMKARAQELKAEARANRNKADGERDVLAAIAAMKGSDRSIAKRFHAIVTATAPDLGRRPGTGCPRTRGTARSSASSRPRGSSTRAMRRSASTTGRTSTRAPVAGRLRVERADRRRRGKDHRAREEGRELSYAARDQRPWSCDATPLRRRTRFVTHQRRFSR